MESFSELRSLMQQPTLEEEQRAQLWELMQKAWAHEETAYTEQWIPYMKGFPHHFVEALAQLTTRKDLARACQLAPHARFDLDLNRTLLRDEGARALANSPHLAQLTTIDLGFNAIGDEGARALAGSPHLDQLNTLDLGSNAIGDEGARALANSPHLAQLTTLDLRFNYLRSEGALALANSPYLDQLTTLVLGSNAIGDEGARALANSPHLAQLTTLDLQPWHPRGSGEALQGSKDDE